MSSGHNAGSSGSSGGLGRSVGLLICHMARFGQRVWQDPLGRAVLLASVAYGGYVAHDKYSRRRRSDSDEYDLDASSSPDGAAHMGKMNHADTPSSVNVPKGLGPPPSTSPITRLRSTDFNFPEITSKDSGVLVIGVAGGSGSGKTTYSRAIYRHFGVENMAYLMHDCYYKDLSHLPHADRAKVNFDHPDSLDTELMIEHITQLKRQEAVDIPTYDFAEHIRGKVVTRQGPKTLILIEGILIFNDPRLYDLMDIKIFLRTDDDIRLIRRMKRDIEERGRTVQGVVDQYLRTVRPMHVKYVEPSMKNADIIVPEGMNNVALDLVVHRLNAYVMEKSSELHLRLAQEALINDRSPQKQTEKGQ
eukprot:GSChrysophyteH1.ASY1.ANO1.2150.1 assembled CDS